MSAFSRGLFLRHPCLQNPSILLQNSFTQARSLSSSSILHAVAKPKPTSTISKTLPKSKVLPTTTAPSSAISKSYRSYAEALAQKSHATLLYQAPSHTGLMIACYGTSLFCLSYAGISYWSNFVNAPPDIAPWVPYAFTLISFMMAVAGGWVLQTPQGIVRSITALPRSLHIKTGKGAFPSDLQLEIELKKMFPIPFFPARKIYVQPSELQLPSMLVPPMERKLTGAEVARMRAHEAAKRKRAWEYDQSHIMTSPFRHMSRGFFQAFTAMKRSWVREGFMKIEAKDRTYKLDVSDGWALDGGRALDRLATRKGL